MASAGPGATVVHTRLAPPGACNTFVKSGFCPCVTAHGVQASAHRKNSESEASCFGMYSVPRWARLDPPKITRDAARYAANAQRAPTHPLGANRSRWPSTSGDDVTACVWTIRRDASDVQPPVLEPPPLGGGG